MHDHAIEDGIRFISRDNYQPTIYYPKCTVCGQEMPVHGYKRNAGYKCKACKLKERLADKERKSVADHETKEAKLKQALIRIEKKARDMSKYDRAIGVVQKHLHRPGWFDSTEEIMVALELLKNNIVTRHQVKMGRYRADFVLPDEKVVLEVDGTLFHTKRTAVKETVRDQLIILALGPEWEVVRITDELINTNITKLVPAIKKVRERRKTVRSKNDGALPGYYTDRPT